MSLWRRALAVAAGVALLAAPLGAAVAQELKIGFVNPERMLRDSQPARARATQKLEGEFSKRDNEMQDAGRSD